MTAVVADDYNILSAVQVERVSRYKGEKRYEYLPDMLNEALSVAGKTLDDVEVFAVARMEFLRKYFYGASMNKRVLFRSKKKLRKDYNRARWLSEKYRKVKCLDYKKVIDARELMDDLGLPEHTQFFDYSHHIAHALSALFFTDWDDALLYTADGGGDWTYYSAHHLHDNTLKTFYGGDELALCEKQPYSSLGLAYSYMTKALGYTRNRHEGKLTGLAAYGQPLIYNELEKHFTVEEDGRINSDFSSDPAMQETIASLAKDVKPEDAAASIQKLLEEFTLRSVKCYLKRTGSRKVGLAGGVFANVSLNRRIAELPEVDEVFIFPGMGDEGIAVGGLYQFLLKRDGLEHWLAQRKRLNNTYWGGAYKDDVPNVFNALDINKITPSESVEDITSTAARLLSEGAIIGFYDGRMEFGPRALGARSILASPVDRDINNSLNKRLERTEFMPFAPVVLAEDAADIFEVTPANEYAMRFMTITCLVREHWCEKIPAVMHIDGTARPQILYDEDAPLYAGILRKFKELTGLPVLVNTSFNAHEEPIINTPMECIGALRNNRVDYVATSAGIFEHKNTDL